MLKRPRLGKGVLLKPCEVLVAPILAKRREGEKQDQEKLLCGQMEQRLQARSFIQYGRC